MSPTITFHHARPEDADTVGKLARLDSARPLRGDVVIGLVDGWAVAAISLGDHRVVADPFVRTAHVVDMLRAYALGAVTDGVRRRRPAPVARPVLRAA
jgi:hypothetical protein